MNPPAPHPPGDTGASQDLWQGRRVHLRAIEPGDWPVFAAWNRDGEAARRSYWLPFPQSDEAVRRWAETTATREPEHDAFFFVVENLAGELVGSISTHDCRRRNGTFSYGLAIRAEHQRQGHASEAIRLVLRYYFQELRYQKVVAHVYAFNEPSIRLHEALGFQLEGRLRRMIYTNGQLFDELVFGLTDAEFAAGAGGAG